MQTKYMEPNEQRSFEMRGVQIHVRAGAADTGGRFTALEQVVRPGAGSPPHTIEAGKIILVLDGTVEVLLGEERRLVPSGGTAFAPAGVVHCFRNPGPDAARILVLTTPGGHEDFLAEAAASPDGMTAAAARHGVRFLATDRA